MVTKKMYIFLLLSLLQALHASDHAHHGYDADTEEDQHSNHFASDAARHQRMLRRQALFEEQLQKLNILVMKRLTPQPSSPLVQSAQHRLLLSRIEEVSEEVSSGDSVNTLEQSKHYPSPASNEEEGIQSETWSIQATQQSHIQGMLKKPAQYKRSCNEEDSSMSSISDESSDSPIFPEWIMNPLIDDMDHIEL